MDQTGKPIVILVRPQMGANIGAAARAMLNFGLTELRLVAPRDGWPNPGAVAMASGAAGQVLDHARVFDNLADAMADVDLAYATTARRRDLTKRVLNPNDAMSEAREHVANGRRIALIFGPERTGLDSDEVARASVIVTVPVNPDFPSINLAQAVLLMGYEWGREMLSDRPHGPARSSHGAMPANHADIEVLSVRYETELEKVGFFHPPEKAPVMRRNLRNLWSRIGMTRAEAAMLHGIVRRLTRER